MTDFLAVDTSSRYLTVLAVKGGKKILKHIPDCAMRHSVMLMDVIDSALREAELKPEECNFFAAVTGPGSFTGIRIGIATAKGFAKGTGKPLLPITSFNLLAYNVADEKFYTVIDAAHNHYYVCGYGEGKRITAEPAYLSGEQVVSLNAPLYGFEDLPLPNYTRLNPGECLYPAICAGQSGISDSMSALYVRKSQAEEGRK